jgi:hypothetical protein
MFSFMKNLKYIARLKTTTINCDMLRDDVDLLLKYQDDNKDIKALEKQMALLKKQLKEVEVKAEQPKFTKVIDEHVGKIFVLERKVDHLAQESSSTSQYIANINSFNCEQAEKIKGYFRKTEILTQRLNALITQFSDPISKLQREFTELKKDFYDSVIITEEEQN